MKKEEQLKRIIRQLNSGDIELIDQTIEEIGESGDSSFISALTLFLHETDNLELKGKIFRLFSELKRIDTVPALIEMIQDPRFENEQAELIACCWQNGLNYSQYLPFFTDLVIEKEFKVAFEAFTVIENMFGKIDELVEQQTLGKINKALETADDQKSYLLKGLLEIIPDIPEIQEEINL